MYFIKQGIVEVQNNETDEIVEDKAILYLPKYSYFGDYQILRNLKSNLVIKTLKQCPNMGTTQRKQSSQEDLPDIIFYCVNKQDLLDICDLFPQTAENITKKALERRKKLMHQKNVNSKKYW